MASLQSFSVLTKFKGESLNLRRSNCAIRRQSYRFNIVGMIKTKIQFIQGIDEITIPDVKLTKSRDGSNGKAIFRFVQPSIFDSFSDLSEITGFFMTDEEGLLQSVDVSAKFVNGKPFAIEAKYIMKTPRDWDRFIRFMERYSKDNGLQFIKS
ncbi:photosystem II reaction center PSB28 protein, chloroplastic-like [Impatiens glandulifera]|uniref:photosystem II reaction center PSB28 protein, chloroplastic-like n=1 Tax=Impatiens glandulifera TaxID=253017 RepID=UPI001FB17A2E|nr:photosystem II reaction center PSB28 protein, chloroplastic-like [Impatiens glandulifera]